MPSKNTLVGLAVTLFAVLVFMGCTNDKDDTATPANPATQTTDATLSAELKSSAFTFYKNDSSLLTPQGNSPHGRFRLKFNAIAQSALDPTTGKLPQGQTFADGALIVKETYSSNGAASIIAIMKKEANNANAAGGWVWSELGANGTSVAHSISLKGAGCIGCHSGNTNRDLVTSFDLH